MNFVVSASVFLASPFSHCLPLSLSLLLTCRREKEHDLERRFELLNRELRAMLAIEGKTHKYALHRVLQVSHGNSVLLLSLVFYRLCLLL